MKWIQVLQKYCKSQRKMTLRKCCSHMERPVAEHGSKTREERQNYLPSNTHLEGLQGSFNGKWQGFSMVCSESEIRLVELFKFPG